MRRSPGSKAGMITGTGRRRRRPRFEHLHRAGKRIAALTYLGSSEARHALWPTLAPTMTKISIRFPLGRDEDIFDVPAYRTGRREVRALWDEENAKWWFSVLDMVAVLSGQDDCEKTRNYRKYLKDKLKREKSEVVSATTRLKLLALAATKDPEPR